MLRTRVIPTLLIRNGDLVKGCQFKNHRYVGDPINVVKIFNEKEVDELVFLDISATSRGSINYEIISDIASEAFMPFAYGGGIATVTQIEKLFQIGVEKVIINSAAQQTPDLIKDAVKVAGSQSIVLSMDVKKTLWGSYEVYTHNATTRTKTDPVDYAKRMQDLGVGEIIICAVDREGTGKGYDLKLLKSVSSLVDIPVVAAGGASSLDDFRQAVEFGQASAVAGGDMFIFYGKRRAVLATYPSYTELEKIFFEEGVNHEKIR